MRYRWYLVNCLKDTSSLITQMWVYAASVSDLRTKLFRDGYQFISIADVE